MNEKIPDYLKRKINKQVAFFSAGKPTDEAVIRNYNASYGKYAEAIMDRDGTATDHYIDKEAYKRIAAMRGIQV